MCLFYTEVTDGARNCTRSDCNNHGTCMETTSNQLQIATISCVCDAGFTGDHCETGVCLVKIDINKQNNLMV